MENGKSVGDSAVAVLHVDDDEVVAGETGDLGERRGEGEKEEAVESFAIAETRLQCAIGGGGSGGEGFRGINGRWN